jgi:hypothetical protein
METVKKYGAHLLAVFGAVCIVALIVARVRKSATTDAA